MRLLLDSHAFLWATTDPDLLSPAAKSAIGDRANVVFISAASIWELAIKEASGRIRLPNDVEGELSSRSYLPLPITIRHARAAAALPPHHRDPFDRMLIAQAQVEGLIIVTRDTAFGLYDVPLLRA